MITREAKPRHRDNMATKKKAAAKRKTSSGSTPKAKKIVGKKMKKTMHEFKHHELKSGRGGKAGKVKNPKQAIAIGLSEARRAGADVPPAPKRSKAGKKKSATKKSVTARKRTKKKTRAKRKR